MHNSARYWIWLVGLLTTLCLALAPALEAQTADGVTGENVTGVTIKALNDPNNPYAGQYEDWDYWLRNNLITDPDQQLGMQLPCSFDEFQERIQLRDRPDWLFADVRFDADGYQVPTLVSIRERHEALNQGEEEAYRSAGLYLQAIGQIDPDLRTRFNIVRIAQQASYYPPVPAWLAADLPYYAMLLPDGRVVTLGLLGWCGTDQGWTHERTDGEYFVRLGPGPSADLPYALYSSSGELIRTTRDDGWSATDPWWYLVNPELKDTLPGQLEFRRDGVVISTDPQTGEVIGVWSWDGEPLGTAVPPMGDAHPFTFVDASELGEIYEGRLAASGQLQG